MSAGSAIIQLKRKRYLRDALTVGKKAQSKKQEERRIFWTKWAKLSTIEMPEAINGKLIF